MSGAWLLAAPAALVLVVALLAGWIKHRLDRPATPTDRLCSRIDAALDAETLPYVITRSPAGWRHGLGVPAEHTNTPTEDQ